MKKPVKKKNKPGPVKGTVRGRKTKSASISFPGSVLDYIDAERKKKAMARGTFIAEKVMPK